ncbi:MAG TPA: hypothetical protein VNS12_13410 [Pelagibacterium sp.]|uniref:hypothetical protein n=1 Tax=Pelagibacterium sp. TaxID=1967288 RepID=UPI002BB753B3|nr:hypothetical protein [Pelagibacterium sp.]HWJ89060.1 hypothetical protein [Pelagibacterium sp.]
MGYVRVEIDTDDVLDELSDGELLAEVRARKIGLPDDAQTAVRTAIAQIRRGDLADAVTTLEREFFPKWASVFESRAAYEAATNPHVQPLKGQGPMGDYFAKALGASIAAAGMASEAGCGRGEPVGEAE